MSNERGTGRTTRQMENAPYGATFVWCSNHGLHYPRMLAKHLGRDDLIIVGPFHELAGIEHVVTDHWLHVS